MERDQRERDIEYEASQDKRTLRDITGERHRVAAGVVRMELKKLIDSGKHTGKLNLGNGYWIPSSPMDDSDVPDFQYYLINGVVMSREIVGRKLWGLLPKHGLVPTTLEHIPFERYGNMPLDELLVRVKYELNPANANKPEPGNFV